MKIVYTKHALKKFAVFKRLGWNITKAKIRKTLQNPKWKGTSRYGQETAMSLADDKHILRVIINRADGIITVVTFHITRRGTYESTL